MLSQPAPGSSADISDILIDVTFFIDIAMSFNQAFETHQGTSHCVTASLHTAHHNTHPLLAPSCVETPDGDLVIVTDRSAIAHRYLRSWFGIDLLSSIPYDRIPLSPSSPDGGESTGKGLKLIRILRLVRLLKLARILKLSKIASNLRFDEMVHPSTLTLMSLIVRTTFIAHLIACFWFLIASDT